MQHREAAADAGGHAAPLHHEEKEVKAMRANLVTGLLGKALLVAGLLVAPAWELALAQTSTPRITGTVTDDGGAPVTDAIVTAGSTTTNPTRNALTSERGFYALPGLPPDEYEVTVRRLGIQPHQ